MHEDAGSDGPPQRGPLVYRQSVWTRLTHWLWAICLFFLLLSGLQIFNAHPALYLGQESGFDYDNAVLRIGAVNTPEGPRGRTVLFGQAYDTTGVLGMSGPADNPSYTAFPGALTIPSFRDLATGRIVHFFFAWLFVATLAAWLVAGLVNGHIRRDLLPRRADLAGLPGDALDHARLRLRHGRTYGPLQKLSYGVVLAVLFPLVILTGLTMSPGMDAAWPLLLDLFGGRQTARTIHFCAMSLIVLFFVVHIVMVLLAGPLNGLRSMLTGWYRAGPATPREEGDRP